MPFHATVVQVLVASPGDTQAERTAILTDTSRWNGRNAQGRGFILSPWLYELHATPIYGDRPQAIINRQGVDRSDVVVAVFGTKLGTPTGVDVSGTVEEIKRAHELGKPVHVYFSAADLPHDADLQDLAALKDFKEAFEGLYSTYSDPADVARQVRDALEYDLDAFDALPAPVAAAGARLDVSHEHQTEQSGIDKKGKVKYRHIVRDLVIKNSGDGDAEDLCFKVELVDDGGPVHLDAESDDDGWVTVGDLSDGSSRSWTCFPMARRADIRVLTRWAENGNVHTKTFTTTVT
ncbi:hypothetical protein [Aeromicrobium alkaliterrae]|uniref:DUF4062 domain-containing protein n=1 Tax=Aeromicrobium alkaliterrae TaxID=302168 RepID=A0ABN2KE27_9ACTN